MFAVNIYIETDTTCPRQMRRWFGYVVEYQLKSGDVVTREGFAELTATYNQAVIMAILTALKRLVKPCKITIFTNNAHVTDSITYRLEEWAENNFTNPKGESVKNADMWKCLWQMSKSHSLIVNTGSHAYSSWLQDEIKKRKG